MEALLAVRAGDGRTRMLSIRSPPFDEFSVDRETCRRLEEREVRLAGGDLLPTMLRPPPTRGANWPVSAARFMRWLSSTSIFDGSNDGSDGFDEDKPGCRLACKFNNPGAAAEMVSLIVINNINT